MKVVHVLDMLEKEDLYKQQIVLSCTHMHHKQEL